MPYPASLISYLNNTNIQFTYGFGERGRNKEKGGKGGKNRTGKKKCKNWQEFTARGKSNDRMKITRQELGLLTTIELVPSTNPSLGNFVNGN